MSKITLQCEQCGKKFQAWPSDERRFCSKGCADKYQSEKGRVTKACKNCGKSFDVKKSKKDVIQFCNKECRRSYFEKNGWPCERGRKEVWKCKNCSKEFEDWRNGGGKEPQFCSRECWYEYRKKQTAQRESKLCPRCERKLSLDKFRKDSGETDGHDRYCRKCRRELERENQYSVKRCRNNPQKRLSRNIGGAMNKALQHNKAGRHWEDLVGYTLEQLKQRLECQFKEGMNWENYGDWHIDHKKPKNWFDYTTPEDQEFQDCWSLANLQPLWAKENIRKGDSLPPKE